MNMTLSRDTINGSATNNTTTPLPGYHPSCMVIRVTFGFIAFMAIFGNVLVVMVLVKNRILRRHASAVVLLSLAIVDMATGIVLVATPAFIIGEDNVPVPSGIAGELFCRFISSQYFLFTLGKVSIAMMMVLAIERWYAVAKPVRYKSVFTRSRMWVCIVAVCVACFLLNARALFEKVLVTSGSARKCSWVPLTRNEQANRSYVIIHSILTFYIPLAVTMAAFIHLFVVIRGQRRHSAMDARHAAPVAQLVRMCFVTSLVLGICWIPNQVVFVLIKFGVTKPDTTLHHVTVILSMLNSCTNPWIYCATSRTYRKGFWGIFCGCRNNVVATFSTEMTLAAANRLAQT
ncbi:hypothetical protein QZH41_013877 [Actinostola sp. cb2023]|nr:hypothetical protein QZH41_013877 [Actinostola sp. cb2023]